MNHENVYQRKVGVNTLKGRELTADLEAIWKPGSITFQLSFVDRARLRRRAASSGKPESNPVFEIHRCSPSRHIASFMS